LLLSHGPPARLAALFVELGRALAAGGRGLIGDEHAGGDRSERRDDGGPGIATRTPGDGSTHRLIKVFIEPDELAARLGWQTSIKLDEDWVIFELSR
jgi:hypothetical protein